MAYADVNPLSNQSIAFVSAGGPQSKSIGPVKTRGGTALDFTTWDSFKLQVLANSPDVTGTLGNVMTVATGNITKGSDGTLLIKLDTADLFSGNLPGTYGFNLTGKPTSGDDDQLVASGRATLTNS